jgi:hypothetical protein
MTSLFTHADDRSVNLTGAGKVPSLTAAYKLLFDIPQIVKTSLILRSLSSVVSIAS